MYRYKVIASHRSADNMPAKKETVESHSAARKIFNGITMEPTPMKVFQSTFAAADTAALGG